MTESNDQKYILTPKGFLMLTLYEYGLKQDDADEVWYKLEGFMMRRLRDEYPNASTAALVFDAHGGGIVGVDEE